MTQQTSRQIPAKVSAIGTRHTSLRLSPALPPHSNSTSNPKTRVHRRVPSAKNTKAGGQDSHSQRPRGFSLRRGQATDPLRHGRHGNSNTVVAVTVAGGRRKAAAATSLRGRVDSARAEELLAGLGFDVDDSSSPSPVTKSARAGRGRGSGRKRPRGHADRAAAPAADSGGAAGAAGKKVAKKRARTSESRTSEPCVFCVRRQSCVASGGGINWL